MKRLFIQKWIHIILAGFSLIGLQKFVFAQSTDQNALLWEISGQGLKKPSYLFGTHHLLTDSYLRELPEIEKPFASAKGVVVETIIDSSKLQMISAMALMPDKKISDLLSPEDFNAISKELESLIGANLTAMNQLKPISVMVLMTMIYSQKLNQETLKKYPGLPMDYFFESSGKKSGKTITALETLEEQMNLLYNYLPVEKQAKQLAAFANNKELVAQSQIDLNSFYLEKNLNKMYEFSESMPEELGDSDYLLKDRNSKWMNTLPKLIKKESQFIAVGALHLPGPDGLIILFRKKGYTVKPIHSH